VSRDQLLPAEALRRRQQRRAEGQDRGQCESLHSLIQRRCPQFHAFPDVFAIASIIPIPRRSIQILIVCNWCSPDNPRLFLSGVGDGHGGEITFVDLYREMPSTVVHSTANYAMSCRTETRQVPAVQILRRYRPSVTSAQRRIVLLLRNSMTPGSMTAGRSCPTTMVATMASQ
jgi:hypothetical protein